ncbi:hypothetical protein B0H12DRAFT_1137019 [Mycena haematopus]|nr:hypothetical protein B0H12DRAFT_1137019 [Mycena haematopus]
MCGPATWSEWSSVPPTVCFSRTFPGGSTKLGQAILDPGGRFFAVWRDSDLHLYDILTGRCVWTRSESETLPTPSWAMEILDDGCTANFLFLRPARLAIVQVDLITGHSNEVFFVDLPLHRAYDYSVVPPLGTVSPLGTIAFFSTAMNPIGLKISVYHYRHVHHP